MHRTIVLSLGLLVGGLPLQTWAQTEVQTEVQTQTQTEAPDAEAIAAVIASQLQAFNDRDVATAWTFASPMIQGMFGNPSNFGLMVQNGYPMVWDNADVAFLDLRQEGDALVQRLTLRDPQGVRYVAAYQMILTANGWQINGVSIVPAPDVGA